MDRDDESKNNNNNTTNNLTVNTEISNQNQININQLSLDCNNTSNKDQPKAAIEKGMVNLNTKLCMTPESKH